MSWKPLASKGGRKFWAFAGMDFSPKSEVGRHLLWRPVTAPWPRQRPTTVVWSAATPGVAVNGAPRAIKVPHHGLSTSVVKQDLGIAVSQWDDFKYQMRLLSRRRLAGRQWRISWAWYLRLTK